MNEYDSDYEMKIFDQMGKEITDRIKSRKEYIINTRSETKDEKKERNKLTKDKIYLEILVEFANKIELKKYSIKEIEQSGSDDSEVESSNEDFAKISMLNFYILFEFRLLTLALQKTSVIK